jgi:hypothetical protein
MMVSKFEFVLVSLFYLGALSGCGAISLGDQVPNEPVPSNATSVGSGTFTGATVNNNTVTGNAIVYNLLNSDGSSSGNYVLRLANFSATPENGLVAIVNNGSTNAASITILNYAGSTNYSFTFTAGSSFNTGQVTIHSNLHNEDYSEALLR